MRNVETIEGYIGIIERRPTSRNGNPRYMVSISNGKVGAEYDSVLAYTTPDSGIAYEIPNLREGDKVSARIGEHYNVTSIASIEKI